MRIVALALIAALGTTSFVQAADLDCTSFLTGKWAGTGQYTVFGSTTELDNTYTFNADGSFETLNRYRSAGADWQEQAVSGEWTVVPGADANACEVTMSSTFESQGMSGSSSSTSTYLYVDENTFSSMDFPMTRVQ